MCAAEEVEQLTTSHRWWLDLCALKIKTPASGILFDDMLFARGAKILKARIVQLRVEAGIAFIRAQT